MTECPVSEEDAEGLCMKGKGNGESLFLPVPPQATKPGCSVGLLEAAVRYQPERSSNLLFSSFPATN